MEELIARYEDQLGSCFPLTSSNINYFKLENYTVTEQEEAQKLLSDIVFPKMEELLPINGLKKPKVKVWTPSLVKNWSNVQRDKYKELIAGMVIVSPLVYLFGGNVTEAIGIGAIAPWVLSTTKTYQQMNNAEGLASLFHNTFYLHSTTKNTFVNTLAHEATHCFQFQTLPFSNNLRGIFTHVDIMSREGLAESVAQKVSLELGSDMEIHARCANSRALMLLKIAYNKLCDELRIDKKERKYHSTMQAGTRGFNHEIGFSFVELLREERGDNVLEKMLLGDDLGI